MTYSSSRVQVETSKLTESSDEFSYLLDEMLDLLNKLMFQSKSKDRLISDIEKAITIAKEDQIGAVIDFDLENAISSIRLSKTGLEDDDEVTDSKFIEAIKSYLSHEPYPHYEKVSLVEELSDVKYLIERYQENQELAQKIKSFLLLLKNISGSTSNYITQVTSMDEELEKHTQLLEQLSQRVDNFSTLISGFQTQLQGSEDRIANKVRGGLAQDISGLNGRLGTLEGRIPQDFANNLETNISNRVQRDLGQRLATLEGRIPQDFAAQLETNISNRVQRDLGERLARLEARIPEKLVGRGSFWGGIVTIATLFLSTLALTGVTWFMLNSSIDRTAKINQELIDEKIKSSNAELSGKLNSVDAKLNSVDAKLNSVDAKLGGKLDNIEKQLEKLGG